MSQVGFQNHYKEMGNTFFISFMFKIGVSLIGAPPSHHRVSPWWEERITRLSSLLTKTCRENHRRVDLSVSESNGGPMHGNGSTLDFGWWAHIAIYR